MNERREFQSPSLRALAGVALVPAVAVFALTAVAVVSTLSPSPDVYLKGHEVPTFIGLGVAHVGVIGYAIWGLTRFIRGRRAPFWPTALAYLLGGVAAPFIYLLGVRWFSGG